MPAPDLTERATRAAAEVAEEAGLRFGRPTILQDRSNLIVHLAPAPVVARVATTTGLVRRGDAWLAREVAVAGHLARAGAPVVAPTCATGSPSPSGSTPTSWRRHRTRAARGRGCACATRRS
jgi:hypothetical protein